MGMNAISSTGSSMSVMQTASTDLKDQKSKNIQTELTSVKQQMQKLSSDEELSVHEKTNERKRLQREKASLDTELRRHEEELLRSQKRKDRLAELQDDLNPNTEKNSENSFQTSAASSDSSSQKGLPADEEQTAQPGTVIAQDSDGTVILKEVMQQDGTAETEAENKPADETEDAAAQTETNPTAVDPAADARPSAEEIRAMVSADSSMQLASRQGMLVAKTSDGIAILKSEIKLDESRGVDTERKQRELEKMEKQMEREQSFQFSVLSEADDAMRSAPEKDASKKSPFTEQERTFYVSGLSTAQDEQAAQQSFQTGALKAVSAF